MKNEIKVELSKSYSVRHWASITVVVLLIMSLILYFKILNLSFLEFIQTFKYLFGILTLVALLLGYIIGVSRWGYRAYLGKRIQIENKVYDNLSEHQLEYRKKLKDKFDGILRDLRIDGYKNPNTVVVYNYFDRCSQIFFSDSSIVYTESDVEIVNELIREYKTKQEFQVYSLDTLKLIEDFYSKLADQWEKLTDKEMKEQNEIVNFIKNKRNLV